MEAVEWQQWSKEELDYQYSSSRWSIRGTADEVLRAHLQLVTQTSKKNKKLDCQLDVAYGSKEGQKLDIFGLDICDKDAPIFVYIHGGYWQELSRPISAYCVEPLQKAGVVTVIVGYDLAPKEIVEEIREAVLHLLQLASERASKGIVLGGHSAGAHLAAMAVHSDLLESHPLLAPFLKGVVYISGVFDLRPLLTTYVNEPLNLGEKNATELSPLLLMGRTSSARYNLFQIIAVGGYESPEFKRQSREYYEGIKKVAKGRTEFLLLENMDHFNIVEDLAKDDYQLTKRILALLKDL